MMYISGKVVADLPAMLTPSIRNRLVDGQAWAADNGRYSSPSSYTDAAYLAWLATMPAESCLFATAPDTFGDAEATLRDSLPVLPLIRELGYRAALVAQPTMTVEQTPWDAFDVLFVGGPDSWQHSEDAVALIREAKRRGLWVHMGRVNGLRRMRYAHALGVDSVDGTFLAFGPDANRPRLDGWLAELAARPHLWGDR